MSPLASRRILRTDTRAFSASSRAPRIKLFRVSSVSAGIGTLIKSPDVDGLSPKLAFIMAFSISGTMGFSQGDTAKQRPSSTEILANWLRGVSLP